MRTRPRRRVRLRAALSAEGGTVARVLREPRTAMITGSAGPAQLAATGPRATAASASTSSARDDPRGVPPALPEPLVVCPRTRTRLSCWAISYMHWGWPAWPRSAIWTRSPSWQTSFRSSPRPTPRAMPNSPPRSGRPGRWPSGGAPAQLTPPPSRSPGPGIRGRWPPSGGPLGRLRRPVRSAPSKQAGRYTYSGVASPRRQHSETHLPDRRRTPKSKYTVDRNLPGAFEGETVTRRRS